MPTSTEKTRIKNVCNALAALYLVTSGTRKGKNMHMTSGKLLSTILTNKAKQKVVFLERHFIPFFFLIIILRYLRSLKLSNISKLIHLFLLVGPCWRLYNRHHAFKKHISNYRYFCILRFGRLNLLKVEVRRAQTLSLCYCLIVLDWFIFTIWCCILLLVSSWNCSLERYEINGCLVNRFKLWFCSDQIISCFELLEFWVYLPPCFHGLNQKLTNFSNFSFQTKKFKVATSQIYIY